MCGSTKFKDKFLEVQKELTLKGYIVLSVGCFGHSGDIFTDEQKVMLDALNKIKAEIKEESRFCPFTEGLEHVLEIIDKHTAEEK